jgi:hypothetical protein
VWRKRASLRSARYEAEARKREARYADFLSGAASLGSVDFGVISLTSLDTIRTMIVQSVPIIAGLYKELFIDSTIRVLHADDDASNRDSIMKQLAEDIHERVQTLEDIAKTIGPQGVGFITSYRHLLKKKELTDEERDTLRETKAVFNGDRAKVFRQYSDFLASFQGKFALLQDKQQDLDRMSRRLVKAMNDIETTMRSVASFCANEMGPSIDDILGT